MRKAGFALCASMMVLAGCQTTGSQSSAALTATPDQDADAVVEATAEAVEGETQEKQSLDALLDEHDKVTLLDDDTGEEKLICKRIESRTGSRLGARKLCATRKEWREREDMAKGEVDGIQRRMDGRCPANGPGGSAGAC